MLLHSIEGLLNGFNDDHGCSEVMYTAVYGVIEQVIGPQASKLFSHAMRCTEGRYFLPKTMTARDLFVDMINVSI